MRKMRRIRSSYACAKYHTGLCSLFIHCVVSNDFVSGSEGPVAHADLARRFPHMPDGTFSHGEALIIISPNFAIIKRNEIITNKETV